MLKQSNQIYHTNFAGKKDWFDEKLNFMKWFILMRQDRNSPTFIL